MQSVSYYSNLSDRTNNFVTEAVFLQVNCAGHAVYPFPPVGNSVRHDYYFLYLVKGEIRFYKPTLDRSMQAGDLVIIEAENPFHYVAVSDSVDYYWVHFTGSEAKSILKRCHIPLNTRLEIQQNQLISDAFLSIFLAFNEQNSFTATALAASLLSLFLKLGRHLENNAAHNRAAAMVARTTAYIHENLSSPLSVDALAQEESFSPGRFREIFREVIGMSPQEYILRLRINVACDLLRHTDAPIGEIAQQVGYADLRYFSRLFSGRIGKTPSEYRNSKRNEKKNRDLTNGKNPSKP